LGSIGLPESFAYSDHLDIVLKNLSLLFLSGLSGICAQFAGDFLVIIVMKARCGSCDLNAAILPPRTRSVIMPPGDLIVRICAIKMTTRFSFVVLAMLASIAAAGGFYYLDRSKNIASSASQVANTPGMTLAVEKGCNACHSFDGSAGIGPSWKGAYGTLRMLNDGSQIIADEVYIRRSIHEPAAEVVEGFDNIMVAPELSDAELNQLLQLIKELGTKPE
jgi:cytochrome c551/c552